MRCCSRGSRAAPSDLRHARMTSRCRGRRSAAAGGARISARRTGHVKVLAQNLPSIGVIRSALRCALLAVLRGCAPSVDTAEGAITIDGKVFQCPDSQRSPRAFGRTPVRGRLIFARDTVGFQLEVPDGKPGREPPLPWAPYKANGRNRLERPANTPLEPRVKSVSDCGRVLENRR